MTIFLPSFSKIIEYSPMLTYNLTVSLDQRRATTVEGSKVLGVVHRYRSMIFYALFAVQSIKIFCALSGYSHDRLQKKHMRHMTPIQINTTGIWVPNFAIYSSRVIACWPGLRCPLSYRAPASRLLEHSKRHCQYACSQPTQATQSTGFASRPLVSLLLVWDTNFLRKLVLETSRSNPVFCVFCVSYPVS